MHWPITSRPIHTWYLIFTLVFHRSAAIVIAHNAEFSSVLPCSSNINVSNVSDHSTAQFDEDFQAEDDNVTNLDNVSNASSVEADDTPSNVSSVEIAPVLKGIRLNPSQSVLNSKKTISKLSLGRPPGDELDENASLPMTSSRASSYITSNTMVDTLAPGPSPQPPPSQRSLQSAPAGIEGSGQAWLGSNDREAIAKTLKVIIGVLLVTALLLGGVSLFDNTRGEPTQAADTTSQVRQWVRSLPLSSGDDVEKIFKSKSGYDCLHHQPQLVPGPVRLEGNVVAMPHNVLKAPLAQRNCVLFSASAAAVRLDGVRAPPAAFYAMNSDFELDLKVSTGSLRIRIHGGDVELFDVASGWQRERTTWVDAPEHLQDFLHTHRATGASTPLETSVELDFTECRLDVGARVTCVGELRREPTGEICLWPCQDMEVVPSSTNFGAESIEKSAVLAFGLTSWEQLTPRTSPRMGKVMISDDPGLLRQSKPNLYSGIVSWMHSLYDRVCLRS